MTKDSIFFNKLASVFPLLSLFYLSYFCFPWHLFPSALSRSPHHVLLWVLLSQLLCPLRSPCPAPRTGGYATPQLAVIQNVLVILPTTFCWIQILKKNNRYSVEVQYTPPPQSCATGNPIATAFRLRKTTLWYTIGLLHCCYTQMLCCKSGWEFIEVFFSSVHLVVHEQVLLRSRK